ncbi:MAG: UvrD-helicase domain-containing protein, partial [Bacillota bacterium]
MTDLKLKDEKAREKITTILDKNILVEAGAGSGKTTSLVKRLVALIKSGQYSIDEISAITFTRKAAAELKGRFESKLEEELKTGVNKEEKNNMKKALDNLDQCFTGTIHSFCAKILRERPVEAGIDPDFDEIDEIEEKVLREESWQEFLKKSARENKEIMNKLQKLGISPLELKESFKKINLYPEVSIETKKIDKPDLKSVMERVIEFSKKAAEYIPDQEPEKGYDKLQSTVNYVLKMKNYLDLNEDKNIIKLLSQFTTNQYVTLNRWKDRDTAREYRDQKTKFLKENHINPALREWRQYLHYYIYKFLEPACNFYERKRREKGVTNFQDLLLLTARMLRENPEVRKYFHEKYKTLLVDEFQDTDPVQAEIIFYLTTNDYQEKRWDKCQPEAGSLFVVGDPKQSIYRFRRADIDIYQKVKELIENSGGEVLSLSSNFRSLDSIADYLNPVFSDIFPEEDNKYQAQFAPINTVHENKYNNGVKYYTIS